ncbi:MAG: hypothetical protein M1825_006147 [Sarcosagium campestre]|nr:MAG: hypothetical protein M1825_006147 [Sarcosagium campestre]
MMVKTRDHLSIPVAPYNARETVYGKHGCAEPPTRRNRFPGGLEQQVELMTYRGDDLIEDLFIPHFKTLGQTYQTFGLFGRRTIFTADPRLFQTALATKFKDFELGESRRNVLRPLIGDGIFAADGPHWEHARALMRPQFTRKQINDYEEAERHVCILFEDLKSKSTGWTESTNLMPALYNLTLDISTHFLFGRSVDSQLAARDAAASGSLKSHGDMGFSEAFDYATEFMIYRFFLQDLYFLVSSAKFRRSLALIHDYVNQFVERAVNLKESALKPNEPDKSTPERFVFLNELAAMTQDPKELRDQLLSLLAAGRDTTSSLLAWIFFHLSRHPDVYARLRREVLAEFGDENSGEKSNFELGRLKSVRYLQWVINEALRVVSLTPLNGRTAARDTVLPTGGGPDGRQPIAVMKGDLVFMWAYQMHRRKDLWGEDATEFKPERWESRPLGWDYVPFSGGPRVCIGQQYAIGLVSFVTARFCQRFDKIENTGGPEDEARSLRLTLTPKNGVNVRLRRADGQDGAD